MDEVNELEFRALVKGKCLTVGEKVQISRTREGRATREWRRKATTRQRIGKGGFPHVQVGRTA